MKRTYFPGIIDVVVVTDPAEIRTISNDPRFDRDFIKHGPIRNVQRLRKMLRIFSLNGRLFEPLLPRTSPGRAAAQDELWSRLKIKADEVKHGPAELEPLTEWVRGVGDCGEARSACAAEHRKIVRGNVHGHCGEFGSGPYGA